LVFRLSSSVFSLNRESREIASEVFFVVIGREEGRDKDCDYCLFVVSIFFACVISSVFKHCQFVEWFVGLFYGSFGSHDWIALTFSSSGSLHFLPVFVWFKALKPKERAEVTRLAHRRNLR